MDKTTPSQYSNHSNNLNWITDSENEFEDDPIISLDDDGLPCENLHSTNNNHIEKQEEDSFAGDFYRSGTDWSCLSSSSSNATSSISTNASRDEKKRLKQSNLFELWKLPSKPNVEASTSVSVSVSVSNKKMKKSMDDFPTQRDQKQKKQQPRACPFYKKMPGNYALVEL